MPLCLQNLFVKIHRRFRILIFEICKSKRLQKCADVDKKVLCNFNKSRKYGPLKHICYAPHTSMFFSRSGFISPCYASYNNKSSHVSQSSLKDIWFNLSFKNIRNEHNLCNLDSTCGFCKEIMQSESFGSLLINKYEHYAFSKSDYPVIMEFELSNTCNLSCIMCDSNLSSGIASDNCETDSGNIYYKEEFFDELREFIPHLQLAEFTGGDPFMIEEYYRIWDMILELNPKCQILITTNANTMNPRIESLMKRHSKINFNISIDSLEKVNYENIRRNGNFEFALKNIDKFVEYARKNKTHVNLLVCPMTVNIHELADFVNFANHKQICVYYHTVVKPRHLSLKFSDKKELKSLILDLSSKDFSSKTKNERTNAENFKNLVELLISWSNEDEISQNSLSKSVVKFNIDEARAFLIDRVSNNTTHLVEKIERLNSEVFILENAEYVFNRLCSVRDEEFFEYLASKSLEELIDICKNFKPKEL